MSNARTPSSGWGRSFESSFEVLSWRCSSSGFFCALMRNNRDATSRLGNERYPKDHASWCCYSSEISGEEVEWREGLTITVVTLSWTMLCVLLITVTMETYSLRLDFGFAFWSFLGSFFRYSYRFEKLFRRLSKEPHAYNLSFLECLFLVVCWCCCPYLRVWR